MAEIRVSITGSSLSLEETSRLIRKIPCLGVNYPNILGIQENSQVFLGHLSFDLLRLYGLPSRSRTDFEPFKLGEAYEKANC
jgi:hypothetical protein